MRGPLSLSVSPMDTIVTAILLGILEGLTEFLPVSSTGHLILAQAWFGYDPALWRQYNIIIQLGAILAVVVTYFKTFWTMGTGLLRGERKAILFVRNILLAFLPAAVIGLLILDVIDAMLESPAVVAIALIVGAVFVRRTSRLPAGEGMMLTSNSSVFADGCETRILTAPIASPVWRLTLAMPSPSEMRSAM